MAPLSSKAATDTFTLDTLYAGTSPGAATPWLSASITDVKPGTVLMSLTANNLSGSEYVSSWDFNLSTALSASSLNIVKTNLGSGTVNGTIVKGNNTINSGGAGNFDFGFDFATSGIGAFTDGDTLVFLITGISGLNAASFNYLSQGGSFYTAATINGLTSISRYCGSSSTDGKVGDNTNNNPAPEPATMAIMGSFVALGVFLKKRNEKTVTA
ncbi:MAG TPA: hypothetical protein VH255_09970 [Verrucomicrobiae bacterium]|nr:hypothetical protein [Verrucomicrobiae bacterium]